jgi:hypothetical protein
MDVADRISSAALDAERIRTLAVEGGEVLEVDGLVVTLTNLPAPELNGVRVASAPTDPADALAAAEQLFRDRGHRFFGIEVEVGRHPTVEAAIREAGLERVEAWPAMAAAIAGLPDGATPAEVEIRSVAHATDLAAVRAVEVDTFGTPPEVAERFVGPSMLAEDHVRMFTAWIDVSRSARRAPIERGPRSGSSASASWNGRGGGGSAPP